MRGELGTCAAYARNMRGLLRTCAASESSVHVSDPIFVGTFPIQGWLHHHQTLHFKAFEGATLLGVVPAPRISTDVISYLRGPYGI